MVRFFSKKIFLVDLLEGFVDIHNHILPGIDDGAKTVDDSIEILKGFSEFGVHNFIATPHIMHNYYDNTPATIAKSLNQLRTALSKNKLNTISVDASAEHMIDDNFEAILANKSIMPLRKDHLLIEMSYLQRPINFDEAIVSIAHNRYFPVLAHPERYNFLHARNQKYGEFKKQGILFQLNMLSLGEFYGKDVQKMAFRLLDEDMIDFLGSDVHNISQLNALKQITIPKKKKPIIEAIIEGTVLRFL